MKFSVCTEMFYPDCSYIEKIKRIRERGFREIELWSIYDKDVALLKDFIEQNDIDVVTFSGHRNSGAAVEAERKNFLEEIKRTADDAHRLGCPSLMVLSNALGPDGTVLRSKAVDPDRGRRTLIESLFAASDIAEEADVTLLLEPLNTYVDHPGYFLDSSEAGFDIISAVGSERVKLLFDIYHMQIMEGDVVEAITSHIDKIGHVHMADVPGRHEPGTGELDWQKILDALDAVGYTGTVGFELSPAGDSDEALDRIVEVCEKAKF